MMKFYLKIFCNIKNGDAAISKQINTYGAYKIERINIFFVGSTLPYAANVHIPVEAGHHSVLKPDTIPF
jgi:hypothetical protein